MPPNWLLDLAGMIDNGKKINYPVLMDALHKMVMIKYNTQHKPFV